MVLLQDGTSGCPVQEGLNLIQEGIVVPNDNMNLIRSLYVCQCLHSKEK